MLTKYIEVAMKRARCEVLEDGAYFGRITRLKGLWANGPSLEACKQGLSEALEDWLVTRLRHNDPLPRMGVFPWARRSSFQHNWDPSFAVN
jgi:predicted RNase H-like HicB family nuclease